MVAEVDTLQGLASKPLKSFIACGNCKARKKGCDGKTPRCGNCMASNADCNYATVRKTRGPGKKKRNPNNSKALDHIEHRPEDINGVKLDDDSTFSVQQSGHGEGSRLTHHVYVPSCISSTSTVTSTFTADPSRKQVQIRARIPTLPDFLAADQFNEHLEKIRSSIAQANLASELTPLLPQHIATRLIQNSFAEIMECRQLLDLADFTALLNDQYIASSTGPAGNFARWAIANAVTALALRFKAAPGAAPGSEDDLSSIPLAFYHNATAMIHRLILQEPSLLSIQALLAMAMFVEDTPESAAFVMLGTNASRQLQLFESRMPEDFKSIGTKSKQHQRVCEVSSTFDKKIGLLLSSDASQETGGSNVAISPNGKEPCGGCFRR